MSTCAMQRPLTKKLHMLLNTIIMVKMHIFSKNNFRLQILILAERWKIINFFDINSMYVSTYNKEMPTGRGIEWVSKSQSTFEKKLISGSNISMGSVEWIDYMNNDTRFIDSKGVRQYIQHGWNGSEVKIGNYDLDGYVKVDEIEYALQFDGCYWV